MAQKYSRNFICYMHTHTPMFIDNTHRKLNKYRVKPLSPKGLYIGQIFEFDILYISVDKKIFYMIFYEAHGLIEGISPWPSL